MKLNLGCYDDIKKGYVNLDKKKYFSEIDVIHDLEKLPYPFKDNTFTEIQVNNTLSHVKIDNLDFLNELHRISRNNGVIHLDEPYGLQIFRSPEHYGMGLTFTSLKKLCINKYEYRNIKKFEIISFSHKPTIITSFIPSIIRVFLSRFLNDIISNIIVDLRVIKLKDS